MKSNSDKIYDIIKKIKSVIEISTNSVDCLSNINYSIKKAMEYFPKNDIYQKPFKDMLDLLENIIELYIKFEINKSVSNEDNQESVYYADSIRKIPDILSIKYGVKYENKDE